MSATIKPKSLEEAVELYSRDGQIDPIETMSLEAFFYTDVQEKTEQIAAAFNDDGFITETDDLSALSSWWPDDRTALINSLSPNASLERYSQQITDPNTQAIEVLAMRLGYRKDAAPKPLPTPMDPEVFKRAVPKLLAQLGKFEFGEDSYKSLKYVLILGAKENLSLRTALAQEIQRKDASSLARAQAYDVLRRVDPEQAKTLFEARVTPIDQSNYVTAVIRTKQPVVIDFWATDCHTCELLKPVLFQLALENPDIAFVTIQTDAKGFSEPMAHYRRGEENASPLLVFITSNKRKTGGSVTGYHPERIRNGLESLK